MSQRTIKEKHRRLLCEQAERKSYNHFLHRLRHPKPVTLAKNLDKVTPKRRAALEKA